MKIEDDLLSKTRSVILCLKAHPNYEPDSEFWDRVEDLEQIEQYFKNMFIDEDDIVFNY
jgi:hypothetical protein